MIDAEETRGDGSDEFRVELGGRWQSTDSSMTFLSIGLV